MNNLDNAIAAQRDALAEYDADQSSLNARYVAETTRNLLAALDAARGEAVGEVEQTHPMMGSGFMHTFTHKQRLDAGTKLFAAPPAALAVPAEPDRERVARAIADSFFNGDSDWNETSERARACWRKHADAAIAALAQQPAAAVPEGYALVPVEPTEAMLDVMHDRVRILCNPAEKSASIRNDREVWAAMLAAAERKGE